MESAVHKDDLAKNSSYFSAPLSGVLRLSPSQSRSQREAEDKRASNLIFKASNLIFKSFCSFADLILTGKEGSLRSTFFVL